MIDEEHYRMIRRRVVRRLFLRITFVLNAVFFAMIMTLLIGNVRTTEGFLGMAIVALGWGAFLLGHGSLAFNFFGRLIDRAVRREADRDQPLEKPKRQALEFGDDGELVESVQDVPDSEARQQARQHARQHEGH
ncbi:MAG TPA: hypothetical protein VMT34_14535 [Aggregatilineales bacterium]|nr:hypothetical protein [Aggregatilineales bacterium]